MEKSNKWQLDTVYFLVVIFVIGLIAGRWVKIAMKDKITSGPDDRKVVAIEQSYDFDAAKQRIEEEMQKQASEMQQLDPGAAPEALPGE